jgi:hypothetical protein
LLGQRAMQQANPARGLGFSAASDELGREKECDEDDCGIERGLRTAAQGLHQAEEIRGEGRQTDQKFRAECPVVQSAGSGTEWDIRNRR